MEISKKEEENIIYQRTFNKKPMTYMFFPLIIGIGIAIIITLISLAAQTTDGEKSIESLAIVLFGSGVGSTVTMFAERMWEAQKSVKEYKEQNNKGEKSVGG